MDVLFRDERLERDCNENKRATTRWGVDVARKLRRRLDDLRDAQTLEVVRGLPGRCHELKADRAGQLALDLHGGSRLIFEPADDPIPRKTDGGLDWSGVTVIRILEVVDYHD